MAKKISKLNLISKKKTRIGNGKFTKHSHKGGGPGGSTISKTYRKRYRGQGK